MTLRDTHMSEAASQALPFLESIRQQITRMPFGGHPTGEAIWDRADVDYFSAARIYITFKVKLAEHFPEEIPSETFDFLVDLMIHEWLSRRAGSEHPAELGMPRSATLSPRIRHALSLGFIMIVPDPDRETLCIITLTRSARARLNVFFDYMASYIAVL